MSELASWIQVMGIVGYTMSMSLALLWLGIAIAYLRAGMNKRVWLPFSAGMIAYAVLFGNLVFIATDPTWIDREKVSVIQRSMAILAASLIWVYSLCVLRDQRRQEKKERNAADALESLRMNEAQQ